MAIYNSEKFGPVEVCVHSAEQFENPDYNGIRISWSAANIGFGSCDVVFSDFRGQKMYAETETMCDNDDKEFLKALFMDIVDQIDVID